MATQLFLADGNSDYGTGNNDTNLAGSVVTNWAARPLRTTRGSGSLLGQSNTVTGPTNGVEILSSSQTLVWYSLPLDDDVTVSGSITWNLWGSENNMSANVAINGQLDVIDGATGAITSVDKTANVGELVVSITPATGGTVNNFAQAPAAGVLCKKGDRLRVRVFGDDVGTMASTFTFSFNYAGTTAAAIGDSYLTLTETLTFTEPAGTQIFPTNTASPVATASVDREAWTSRGGGVQNDVTNTSAGFVAPIQLTDTAGGTVVDWFTRQLNSFTLGGPVRCNIRASSSGGGAAAIGVEIAVVDNDGTNPTVFAIGRTGYGVAVGEAAYSFLVGGADLVVAGGRRLRVRLFIDDPGSAMVTAQSITTFYAGASGATGDSYLTFTQTMTEGTSGGGSSGPVPHRTPYPQILSH